VNRRTIGTVALALLACTLTACKTSPTGSPSPAAAGPPPSYPEIADRFNERADRLGRIWANATAQFSYLDEQGDRHNEQGEGHLQLITPDRFALSIGKISEVLFWLGCDADRYWFFEMYEGNRVSIGRHRNIGSPCNRDLGLPANPIDIIDLLGVTPLPIDAPGETSWSTNGKWLVVDAPGRATWRRLFLDPETLLPQRVELYDPTDTSAPIVFSSIELYESVTLEGVGGFFPKAPSRLQIDHEQSGTSIRLFLHNMNDGKTRGRLSDAVFTFESLVEAFGPEEITVLDQHCESPALVN